MLSEENLKARRKFPRRQFHRPVGVLFDGRYEVLKGVELGEGGLSFSVVDKSFLANLILPEGDKDPASHMALVFFVASSEKFTVVRAQARSVRKTNNGNFVIGCQFEDLDFDRKRDIRNFVTSRAQG